VSTILLTPWLLAGYRDNSQTLNSGGYDVPKTAGSEESFRFMRDRFDACARRHANCVPENTGRKWTPTRLIYIGKQISELYLSTDHSSVEYATLSYCWGGVEFLKTTLANYSSLKDNIRWLDLPNVFKDAITVAYSLNLRYLWIDSVCIVQDSDNDWAHESALMAEVYSNASLTIAASSSPNVNVGFLDVSHDPLYAPLNQLFPRKNGPARSLKARKILDKSACPGPLDLRGWRLQETLLSRRSLQFSVDEVKWRCVEEGSCE
jgi:hypothetical protein